MDKEKLDGMGIDYVHAIKRFAGNEKLYEKYLNKFKDEDYYIKSKEAFEAKDYDALLKNIHIMKGVVSTLGMDKLFEACSAVVTSIRAQDYEPIEGQMAAVEQEYQYIMKLYE